MLSVAPEDEGSSEQDERFRYFLEKICKVQVWHDKVVFEELKAISQGMMDRLALVCDVRVKELCDGPEGTRLRTSAFSDLVEAFPASASLAAAEGEVLFNVDGCIIARQDAEQVGAVRVGEADRKEAVAFSLPRLPRSVLKEEIFLAQLFARAELLNAAFQRAVVTLVRTHADGCGIHGSQGEQPTWAISTSANRRHGAWSVHSSSPACATAECGGDGRFAPGPAILDPILGGGDNARADSRCGADVFDADGIGIGGSLDKSVAIDCRFDEGVSAVHVFDGPIKTLARMREKLAEYAPPNPKGTWPLAANILDPVRASVVVSGPGQVRQVVRWFVESRRPGLRVCRLKNGFALPRAAVPDGYRDIKLSLFLTGPDGLNIIGELQVHDHSLHALKRRMHCLYRIKRAQGPDFI